MKLHIGDIEIQTPNLRKETYIFLYLSDASDIVIFRFFYIAKNLSIFLPISATAKGNNNLLL